jgi:hypothetical protein
MILVNQTTNHDLCFQTTSNQTQFFVFIFLIFVCFLYEGIRHGGLFSIFFSQGLFFLSILCV